MRVMLRTLKIIFLLVFIIPITAQAGEILWWLPMELGGGGAGLTYKVEFTRGDTQLYPLELIIEFYERLEGTHDIRVTVKGRRKTQSSVEKGVYPLTWALEGIKAPKYDKNSPMGFAMDFVRSSVFLFNVAGEKEAWDSEFSKPHPYLPGATFTATTTACEAAGKSGRLMAVRSGNKSAEACISKQAGLPLSLYQKDEAYSITYTLVKYQTEEYSGSPMYYRGEPDGFRGIKWGTNISEVKDMVLIAEPYEDAKVYKKRNEDLSAWGVGFDNIEYTFDKGKFSDLTAKTKGAQKWEALKASLFKNYGRAFNENLLSFSRGPEQYVWGVDKVTNLTIEYAADSQEVTLTMYSIEIERESTDKLFEDLFKKEKK